MIWPIVARYGIAFAGGCTWDRSPLSVKLLWVVVLLGLVALDVWGDGLRRDGHVARSRKGAGQLGEDGQVGVESDSLKSANTERE